MMGSYQWELIVIVKNHRKMNHFLSSRCLVILRPTLNLDISVFRLELDFRVCDHTVIVRFPGTCTKAVYFSFLLIITSCGFYKRVIILMCILLEHAFSILSQTKYI